MCVSDSSMSRVDKGLFVVEYFFYADETTTVNHEMFIFVQTAEQKF